MAGWLSSIFGGGPGGGPWGSYQGQPGQAYMAGQQANNIAAGTPNAPIPVPSNPYQNLQQTQAGAAAANQNLAAGGPGVQPNLLDALSKMFGGGGQQGGMNWQQLLAQGAPHLANGQPLGQGGAPSAPMLPQGQMPLSQGLLANVAQTRAPLMNTSPPNAANNFNGGGIGSYLAMRAMLGQ